MFTNEELAREYLYRAKKFLDEGEGYLKKYDYPECVRRCQESVELSVKSMFLLTKGEVPEKWQRHDISDALSEFIKELPENEDVLVIQFKREAYPLMLIKLKALAAWREPAYYGDQEKRIPASKLFGKWEAEISVGWAQSVYSDCSSFIHNIKVKS